MTDMIFDERGERAQKLTIWHDDSLSPGWITDPDVLGAYGAANVLGFPGTRRWRPTYMVSRISRGWRVYTIDYGEVDVISGAHLQNWWKPASPDHKRLPTVAAVEMWVRHMAMREAA